MGFFVDDVSLIPLYTSNNQLPNLKFFKGLEKSFVRKVKCKGSRYILVKVRRVGCEC